MSSSKATTRTAKPASRQGTVPWRPQVAGTRLLRAAVAGGRVAQRRPGVVLAAVALAGGGGLFAWNVLMMQTAPHPAPLFAPAPSAARATPPARRAEPATPPLPVRRPDIQQASLEVGNEPASRTGSVDPIGALIRSGEARPAPNAAAAAAALPESPKPDPARVVHAQKALAKLGYGPLKADGIMGATTRQALERFEKDRGFAVTGSLGVRTTRQLAVASGLPAE